MFASLGKHGSPVTLGLLLLQYLIYVSSLCLQPMSQLIRPHQWPAQNTTDLWVDTQATITGRSVESQDYSGSRLKSAVQL